MRPTMRNNVCWSGLWVVVATSGLGAADSTLRHEVIVDAPLQTVWDVFTTNDGFKTLGVAHAEIDLRVGGKLRSHYDPSGVLGDPNTIENTILAFEPQRMLSIKCTKPPASFPFTAAIDTMWTVIYFEPVGTDRTRVTCVGMGFGDDEESLRMREHFDKGNAWTLAKVKEKFAPGADDASRHARLDELIRSLTGVWTLDHTFPNGSVLKGRMAARPIVDGKFVLSESWLGSDGKLAPHGHAVFGRDPQTGIMRVWDFGEGGKVSGAEVIPISESRWAYDWSMHSPGGASKRFFIEESLEDGNSLQATFFECKDGDRPGHRPEGREPMFSVVWKRAPGGATPSQPGNPGGEAQTSAKRIESEVVVAASLQNVWDAWTTAAGVKTFFAPEANVELRPGGPFEMLFGTDSPTGSRGSEGCTVLAVRPMELFSFSWNAPPNWPSIRTQRTVVVVQFAEEGKDSTRVTLTHLGFGVGKDWDEVHQYFSKAWPVVLGRLQERFAKGPLDWSEVSRARNARVDR